MHQATRVAWNAALLIGKQAVMAVTSVVFIGYLARSVGVSAWGEFQASLAIVAMATVIASLGVRGYLAREIAVHPELGPRHLGSALVVRGVMSALALLVVAVVTCATRSGMGAVLVLVAAASQLATQLYATMWLSFEVHERFQYIVYVELGARLFVIAVSSIVIALGLGIVAAACVFALGNLLELALTYHFLCKHLYRPRIEASLRELVTIARMSLPLGLLGALTSALRLSDRVLLRWLGGEKPVGVFCAAWVLVEQLEMISDFVFGAAFAAGMRLYARDPRRFAELFRTAIVLATALGLPIAAGVCLLAPDVIRLVYGGREFEGATTVLALLAWHVPTTFAFQVAALPLVASKREADLVRVLFPALAANVALDVWLVPRLGATGAALSALVIGAGVLVASAVLARSFFRLAPLRRISAATLSTALMAAAAFFALRAFGMWAAIAAGTIVHAAMLFALRVVTTSELRAVLGRNRGARRDEEDGEATAT